MPLKKKELDLQDYTKTLEELTNSLRLSEKEAEKHKGALKAVLNYISDLIKQVADRQDFSIRFQNPHAGACSIKKECGQTKCPCYGRDFVRCWQVAGTYCGGVIQGKFAQKIDNCINCEIFKEATRNPVYEIGEHFNNLMHILESKSLRLHESEERYRSLSETASDAIVSAGADGKIVYCNSQAGRIFGYPVDEMIGRSLTMLMPESFRKDHDNGMGRFLATREPMVIGSTRQLIGLRHDGEEFPLEMSLATWKSGGKDYFTGIIRDIKERKQMEEELIKEKETLATLAADLARANEELKNTQSQVLQREKMASVGQLAAGVAHEINNPMGFITSNLGTLEKYVVKFTEFIDLQSGVLKSLGAEEQVQEARKKLKLDFLIEDTGDLLHESLDGAKRVTEIVRNLKSFSRLDEAVVSLADINECIETTLKIIWNELKYKTTVHKEYGDLPPTLCNSSELNQVFMNILINAVQAIDKQGDITINTRQQDDRILVSISDTGSGIAADKLERIFEPFFTTKEVGKGTGLGLSICYDIVKKHEGEITAESEAGKGTTFTVTLPVKRQEARVSTEERFKP